MVKIKTIKDDFYKMEKACTALNGRKVNVGVHGDHAWLAAIHEYGLDIKVTDKMRAYLNTQGLHLKKSTQYIHIPERSFLRAGFDENHLEILRDTKNQESLVIDGVISVDEFLKYIGDSLVFAIRSYATDLNSPPNHPFTKKRKNSSNPLIDSGGMIGAVESTSSGNNKDGIKYEIE